MPSFLSRFRSRAISQSTIESAQSAVSPPTPPSTFLSTAAFPLPRPSPAVDRKIHPDVNSLLESYSEVEEQPKGLRPSTRRHSVDGISNPTRSPQPIPARDVTLEEVDETEPMGHPPGDRISTIGDSEFGDDLERRGNLVYRLSRFMTPGEWSTFGRHRDHVSPRLSDFSQRTSPNRSPRHSRFGSSTTVSPRHSPSRQRNIHSVGTDGVSPTSRAVNPSRPSTAPPPSSYSVSTPSAKSSFVRSESLHGSKRTSPANTMSSRKKPTTPTRPRSATSASHPFNYRFTPAFIPVSSNFDSLGTFGLPTPAETHTSGITFGAGSSPPPIPPLNHPEFTVTRSSHSKFLHAFSQDPHDVSTRERTFPRRSTRRGLSNSTGTSSSLPFSLGRSLRSRSNSTPPRIQQLFTKPPQGPSHVSTPRTRTGSSKSKHSRRSSADWTAQQATDGVDWPAQVSREMLRLSLGGSIPGSGGPGGDLPADLDGSRPRGDNAPLSSKPCFSSLSRPFSTSLGSPLFLQGSSTDVPFPSSSLSSSPGATGEAENNLSGVFSNTHHHAPFTSTSSGDRQEGISERGMSTANGGVTKSTKGKASARNSLPAPASTSKDAQPAPSSLLMPPSLSFTAPTPETSPATPSRSASGRTPSTSRLQADSLVRSRSESSNSRGKRKADDVEGTPPDQKKEIQRATFAIPIDTRSQRPSASSHAPSSYHRKRARLSTPLTSPSHSRPGSTTAQQAATSPGSWASRASSRASSSPIPHQQPPRTPSRAASTRSNNHPSDRQLPRRSSMSQTSIPISALISPHAPSISRSATFHMRDPRKPPRKQETGWSLRFARDDEHASPFQAWSFFIGFVLFPLWWIASFWRTPKTRQVGGTDTEKAVTLDDPQVEHDAKSWRFRCRIMSVISFFTYIPFIVLVAIFVPR